MMHESEHDTKSQAIYHIQEYKKEMDKLYPGKMTHANVKYSESRRKWDVVIHCCDE